MSVKKYCDLETLQYYDSKWLLRFEAMEINNDDIDNLLLDNMGIVPTLPTSWTESANGTLDLSSSNAYSYWPEGAGTKTVSIANGTTSGLSKFFLKLTDAGNFPMQWGSNIQWKNGSEPVWQVFNEDIVMFTSNDGGSTWTGQVVQTNEITPYWKLSVKVPWKRYSDDTGYNSEDAYNIRLNLTSLSNDTIINWGDGSSINISNISSYNVYDHEYAESGIYHIKITSNNFHTAALLDWLGIEFISDDRDAWGPYTETLYSIDSPYPLISGIWRDTSTSNHFEESFGGCFYNCKILTQIPDKLFHNNPQSTSFNECFCYCENLASVPSGLFDNNPLVTDFSYCFNECSSITSIPSGLFDNNTAVIYFSFCFSGCYSLTSIPSDLFLNTPLVIDFWECFSGCSALNNFTLYITATEVKSNIGTSNFISSSSSNSTHIVYAPCGSTTYESFLFNIQHNHLNVTLYPLHNDNTFVYTVTTDTDKKAAIPFTLYNVPNTTLCVDWGDGTTSSLTSSNYSEFNTESSVHTYASEGTYTISVNCNNWNNVYLMQIDFYEYELNPNQVLRQYQILYDRGPVYAIYYWRSTVESIDSPFPPIKGTQIYQDDPQDFEDTISYTSDNYFALWFCNHLSDVNENLFYNNSAITSLDHTFFGCPFESLTLRISSSNITSCYDFNYYYDNTYIKIPCTIYVPSGSTSETTFLNYGNNVTVIGE